MPSSPDLRPFQSAVRRFRIQVPIPMGILTLTFTLTLLLFLLLIFDVLPVVKKTDRYNSLTVLFITQYALCTLVIEMVNEFIVQNSDRT